MSDEQDENPDSEPVVQTRYSSGESASEAVIRALAAATGVEPTELDLLYESIDPEALDALLGDPVLGEESLTVVEFVASGHRVVVSSDGQITILDESDE
jgi:ADP-ribose pyrophosphatase YjhB (NUDIX family)